MQSDVGNQLGCHGVPPLHLMVRNASSSSTAQSCHASAMEIKQSWALLQGTVQCSGQQPTLWLLGWQAHEGKASSFFKKIPSSKSHSVMMELLHSAAEGYPAICCKWNRLGTRSCMQQSRSSSEPLGRSLLLLGGLLTAILKTVQKESATFLGRCLGLCRTPGSWGNCQLYLPKRTPFCVDEVFNISNPSSPLVKQLAYFNTMPLAGWNITHLLNPVCVPRSFLVSQSFFLQLASHPALFKFLFGHRQLTNCSVGNRTGLVHVACEISVSKKDFSRTYYLVRSLLSLILV